MIRMLMLAARALAWVTSPALTTEVAAVADKAVILPWGDRLVAPAVSLCDPVLTILPPIITASIARAIRKVYPWAALFLSQRPVEMRLEQAVGFSRKALNGPAKGKTLSVTVAVPVIAKGTQYVIDTAPPVVIKAAGGADGIAARIFRKLDLDDHASEATEFVPAQEQVGAGAVDTDELRRTHKMTERSAGGPHAWLERKSAPTAHPPARSPAPNVARGRDGLLQCPLRTRQHCAGVGGSRAAAAALDDVRKAHAALHESGG